MRWNWTSLFSFAALLVATPAESQIVSGTTSRGLYANAIYVQSTTNMTAGGLALSNVNNSVVAGQTVIIGAGTFDLGGVASFVFKHGVTYIGQGMNATILKSSLVGGNNFIPGSATVRQMTLQAFDTSGNAHLVLGRAGSPQLLGTNALFENVRIRGDTDCLYWSADTTNDYGSYEFRGCKLESGFDLLIAQGSTNAVFKFVNCDLIVDLSVYPTPFNTVQTCRFIVLDSIQFSSNFQFENCTFTGIAGKINNLYSQTDVGFFLPCYVSFKNCSQTWIPTNGASAFTPYVSTTEFTNMNIRFDGLNPVEIVTASAIYTNGLGPQLMLMTSSATRTNWLPKILCWNQSTNVFNCIIGVKDLAGNAATQPIFVQPLGGAKIDNSASNTITANFGVKWYRSVGTNWTQIM